MPEARLLVVDDDPSVRSFLRRGLTYEGFAVELAEDGEQGLRLVEQSRPDLLILDWMMPGLSGLEVLIRVRADWPGLPVLMLTARDTPEDRDTLTAAGADACLVKPVEFGALVNCVRVLAREGREGGSRA